MHVNAAAKAVEQMSDAQTHSEIKGTCILLKDLLFSILHA